MRTAIDQVIRKTKQQTIIAALCDRKGIRYRYWASCSHPEYAGQCWEFFRDGVKLKSFTRAERVIAWLEKQ